MHVLEQTKKKSHHILVLIRASRDEFRNNLKNLILRVLFTIAMTKYITSEDFFIENPGAQC